MSYEDLKEQGILLPEEEWGNHRIETTVSQIPVLLLFVVSIIGCVLMFTGGGKEWTWIGIIIFFAGFFTMITLNNRAVHQQRERFLKERRKGGKKESSSTKSSSEKS